MNYDVGGHSHCRRENGDLVVGERDHVYRVSGLSSHGGALASDAWDRVRHYHVRRVARRYRPSNPLCIAGNGDPDQQRPGGDRPGHHHVLALPRT